MVRTVFTKNASAPISRYSQAIAVEPPSRLLYLSGQIGMTPDGVLLEDEAAQHAQCWKNILAILASEGLGPRNIVDIRGYVTTREGVGLYRSTRDSVLEGHEPASTLILVTELADPRWLVEISVVAAGEPH